MRAIVVGGGSWGSVFAALLAERGHEVTLACRDAMQALAIAETGRNPRYVPAADLSAISATTVEEAPIAEAELVCLAVPSRAFGEVARALPGPLRSSPWRRDWIRLRGNGFRPRFEGGRWLSYRVRTTPRRSGLVSRQPR